MTTFLSPSRGQTIEPRHITQFITAINTLEAGGFEGDVWVPRLGVGFDDSFAIPSANTFLASRTVSASSHVLVDSQLDISGATTSVDSGAIRGIAFQHSGAGAGFIRGVEAHGRRKLPAASGKTWGIEVGVHSEVSHASHDGQVGVYVANSAAGWVDAGVRANAGVLVEGDTGWTSFFMGRSTDNSTIQFRVHAQTTGNDVAGDVLSAGRIYSSNLGATYRIGVVNYFTAPSGVTDGGIWYDTTANRNALWLAAATGGAAYRPVLISPEGGNVGVGVTPAILGTQSGLITTSLQVGGANSVGTISAYKAALSTPSSGYSSIGAFTDEYWYRKTSAGATYQILDSLSDARRNRVLNGAMAVNQRVTMPTTDDNYCLDGWNLLLEAANAATVAHETSDVPTDGSKFGLRLTVGSGEDNKFGVVGFLEYADCADLRGKTVSLQLKMKSTAGITNVRAAVIEWTSTADSITSDVVGTWGAENTNPTLATNWAYCSGYTPVSLAATTSWATYKIEGVISVGASANNLGVLIWVDDETTTQTTDILRITDVQMEEGPVCTQFERVRVSEALDRCRRYYAKSYSYATAPATSTSTNAQHVAGSDNANSKFVFKTVDIGCVMHKAPTVTLYDTAGNSGKISTYDASAALTTNVAPSVGANNIGTSGFAVVHQGTIAGIAFHYVADASL